MYNSWKKEQLKGLILFCLSYILVLLIGLTVLTLVPFYDWYAVIP